jgi:hypothetical protein
MLVLALAALASCGDNRRSHPASVRAHPIYATAHMHVQSVVGRTEVETGYAMGNLHAQLTLIVDRGDDETEFTAATSRGTLAGEAHLRTYTATVQGSVETLKFRAVGAVTRGTGVFTHAYSRGLSMTGVSVTGEHHAQRVITIRGTLYY